MRLLKTDIDYENNGKLTFIEAWGDRIPRYAILSHLWSTDPSEEVLYADVMNGTGHTKVQHAKVLNAILQARQDGLDYIWIDTCCIDKSSSADLSESINTMFRWYQKAVICYAYLEDVTSNGQDLQASRWFKRGWTLQELLAPSRIHFYSSNWTRVGVIDREIHSTFVACLPQGYKEIDLSTRVSTASGIHCKYLRGYPIEHAPIAERMSWAAGRGVTREEDIAYCLLGLFDVNITMLYGEGGTKAFLRLQEAILRSSEDHSIYCWRKPQLDDATTDGLLADSPDDFFGARKVQSSPQVVPGEPATITVRGIYISLPVVYSPTLGYVAVLNCFKDVDGRVRLGIRLRRTSIWQPFFTRVGCVDLLPFFTSDIYRRIYVNRLDGYQEQTLDKISGYRLTVDSRHRVRYTHHSRYVQPACAHLQTYVPAQSGTLTVHSAKHTTGRLELAASFSIQIADNRIPQRFFNLLIGRTNEGQLGYDVLHTNDDTNDMRLLPGYFERYTLYGSDELLHRDDRRYRLLVREEPEYSSPPTEISLSMHLDITIV